jgi:hypothetical protein
VRGVRRKALVVPAAHRHRYLYHFTHLDNLPSLLQTGFLANNHPKFPASEHRSIASTGIQHRRASMVVPCGPRGVVHDYVPLYFGSVSLMLLGVINSKNIDQFEILYFEFPISLLDDDQTVFTDASANTAIPPSFMSDPQDLTRLNWGEIDSLKWKSATDTLRHQRMAEALVYRELPLSRATRCVVWNPDIKRMVERLVKKAGVPFPEITYESPQRRHYFNSFLEDNKNGSLVAGPKEIRMRFEQACELIRAESGKNSDSAPYPKAKDLLAALKKDFGAIPHTKELIGLKSENAVHKETVDVHTQEVVARLLTLPEYAALDGKYKAVVELSAYLHDIGKGPKSRWVNNNGLQKVDPDHPVRAMPMMVEILTKQVGSVKQEAAERLCKLVCYHDLVGEVLGKGRDEQQIVDAASDAVDLDMLFALGKADILTLVPHWWNQRLADSLYHRCAAAMEA